MPYLFEIILKMLSCCRYEFKPSDNAVNPYILHAALIAAGLDGIEREIGM